jgi:exoribonuclease R
LLRGSGYVAFDGEVPDQSEHSALASQYAHVTAPLRRLVDRYALEVCVALSAGREVPDWVTARFDDIADTMRESGRKANQYENAIVDLSEAEVLKSRVGSTFPGVIVEADEKNPARGVVTIQDPAVEARVSAERDLPVGEDVSVELVEADPVTRSVAFRLA